MPAGPRDSDDEGRTNCRMVFLEQRQLCAPPADLLTKHQDAPDQEESDEGPRAHVGVEGHPGEYEDHDRPGGEVSDRKQRRQPTPPIAHARVEDVPGSRAESFGSRPVSPRAQRTEKRPKNATGKHKPMRRS